MTRTKKVKKPPDERHTLKSTWKMRHFDIHRVLFQSEESECL